MRFRTVLQRIVLSIIIALFSISIIIKTFANFAHKSYVFAFILALGLVLVFCFLNIRNPKSFLTLWHVQPVVMCAILSLVCLAVNGAWVIAFHPLQAPDYQTFLKAAVDMANGMHPSAKDYIALFPHILGYSSFLSLFFRVFGQSVEIAAFVNIALTTCSGILIYSLSLRHAGQKTAAIVYLLWIFCPSKLLYNTMAMSEPYYTFLLLLFLTIISVTFEGEKKPDTPHKGIAWYVLLGAASGIILTLVNATRPIGVIPIIAYTIWILLLSDIEWLKKYLKKGSLYFITVLIVYFMTGNAWDLYATKQLEQFPPSIPGYSIYVGFNPETNGSYSDDDMNLLQNRYYGEYNRDAVKTQQSMLESAKARIRETKRSIPKLMIHKLGTLLGHDEGGAYYSKESMTDRQYALWCVGSNTWYYYVCFLAVFGCAAEWMKNRKDSFFYLVSLCIIGVILAQLLVEVAARYHYCIIPMLLLLSGSAVQNLTSATG